MKYHIIAVSVICLILGTGLAAAGTLTVVLEPSLDGKGDIKATSITEAALSRYDGLFFDPDAVAIIRSGNFSSYGVRDEIEKLNSIAVNASNNEAVSANCDFNIRQCSYEVYKPLNKPFNAATIINGTAQFKLGDGDAGGRYIMINNGDIIPTRISDPEKNITQFVGQKLRVSVIGNLSDPTNRIETFTTEQGYDHPAVSYYDGTPDAIASYDGDIYTVLSLKTNPGFQIITEGLPRMGREQTMINYVLNSSTHPSTSTSINPSFSKWMFGEGSHGIDYGGNDSKCSTCHGDLDSKPWQFRDITVNNGFCFRCHYGKGGVDKGFVVDTIGLGIIISTPRASRSTAAIPKVKFITAADGAGKTTTVQINETVLITLEEGFYDWNITVDNQTVLNPVPSLIIRGAQGVYQAANPGRATLIAKGDPICLKSKPRCGAVSTELIFYVIVSGETTPKTPAFEALLAISALLIALLVKRR